MHKNYGLSQSKDLDFNRYIKEISTKMMGLSQSKDLKSYDDTHEKERKIMGFQWSKDLDLLMFIKEKSA